MVVTVHRGFFVDENWQEHENQAGAKCKRSELFK